MPFFVYILRTSGNTLYTGQTNNLEKRLIQHSRKNGQGASYLRLFESFELVYAETFKNRKEAMKRESTIKKLSRQEKERLVGE
jgi:putative endonuclease